MNYNIFVGFIAWIGILERNPDGSARLRFTVAVKNSAKQNSTSFVDCTVFGEKAEFLSKHFVKGSPIGIEAEVRNNNFKDKNGVMHYGYNFIARRIEFVGPKSANPAVAAASNPAIPTGAVPMTAVPSGGLPFPPAPSAAAPATSGVLPSPPAPSTQPAPSATPFVQPMPADADGSGQGIMLGRLEDVFTQDEMKIAASGE